METLQIAAADPDDVPDLRSIENACRLSPWSETAYLDELQRPEAVILKAVTADGVIVGFMVGRVSKTTTQTPDAEAEIYNLGVLPEFQARGVGSRLLERFTRICEERKILKIWLEVRESNAQAISFYRSRGFLNMGIRKAFYTNPVENAEIMCLEPKQPSAGQTLKGA